MKSAEKGSLQSHFWKRVNKEQDAPLFKYTWLKKITDQAKIEFVQKKASKFSHIFQVPFIINDQEFLRRRKTFQTFSKNANLELYETQLKKQEKGMNNIISEKANYEEVITKTKSNQIQQQFLQSLKKNNGVIFDNTLWSDKYYNQILHQSRLNNLADHMQKHKIQKSDELLQQFEQYFDQKDFLPDKKKSYPELIQDLTKIHDIPPSKKSKKKSQLHQILHQKVDEFEKLKQMTHDFQHSSTQHTRPCTHQQLRTQTDSLSIRNIANNATKRTIDNFYGTLHTEPNAKGDFIDQVQQIMASTDDLCQSNKLLAKQIKYYRSECESEQQKKQRRIKTETEQNKILNALLSRNNKPNNRFLKHRLS